ncbi:hypothetical protein CDAR_550271 [Caerostris darwini]|uniref:Uncharacterized protein n=1 Tax=Caerostris darwini TaxID=1538125 RepID=A0AAV4X7X8_9ARAC|nr:hypothetical protein CDAR_550271 [Caerostris darwini]
MLHSQFQIPFAALASEPSLWRTSNYRITYPLGCSYPTLEITAVEICETPVWEPLVYEVPPPDHVDTSRFSTLRYRMNEIADTKPRWIPLPTGELRHSAAQAEVALFAVQIRFTWGTTKILRTENSFSVLSSTRTCSFLKTTGINNRAEFLAFPPNPLAEVDSIQLVCGLPSSIPPITPFLLGKLAVPRMAHRSSLKSYLSRQSPNCASQTSRRTGFTPAVLGMTHKSQRFGLGVCSSVFCLQVENVCRRGLWVRT